MQLSKLVLVLGVFHRNTDDSFLSLMDMYYRHVAALNKQV